MATFKISSRKTLGDILDKMLETALQEAKKSHLSEASDEAKFDADLSDVDLDLGNDDEDDISNDDHEAMADEPDPDDIIEKLNTIRSGRSFRDDDVKGSFVDWFSQLKQPEKVALFAFLKGIAQIVTGEIPGDEAVDPKDDPADVTMKKQNTHGATNAPVAKEKSRHIKPNVVKEPLPSPTKKSSSHEEDTTPPIQVKK